MIRVFTENIALDPEKGGQALGLSISAGIIRSLFGPFIGAPAGPSPGVDPIAGIPAAPFAYKVRCITEVTERNIEVPFVSLSPNFQFVPRENDYCLCLFLPGWQGVAFASWDHIGINGSYRQGRLPLQRGDVAIVARNPLRQNSTLMELTASGVARLAASDGVYLQLHQTPSTSLAKLVCRNFRHETGVATIDIKEGRGLIRPGQYTLEVYERSIARSKTADAQQGLVASQLFGQGIAVQRFGRHKFLRGVPQVDPEIVNFDEIFMGLEEDLLVGNTDPKIRTGRVLVSFYQGDRLGNLEMNAGNYTPPDVEPGDPPLPPESPPTKIADAKIRASNDVKIDAARNIVSTAFEAFLNVLGRNQQVSGTLKFTAGPPGAQANIEISETGVVRMFFGDPDLEVADTEIVIDGVLKKILIRANGALTQISINEITGEINMTAPTRIDLNAPLVRIGTGVPTCIESGPLSGRVCLTPIGGAALQDLPVPTASVTVSPGGLATIIGTTKVIVDAPTVELGIGAVASLVKDTIIPLLDGHSHGGIAPGVAFTTKADLVSPSTGPVPTFGAGTLTAKAKGI